MKQNESNPEKFSARKIYSWQFAFTKRRAREKAWRTAGSDSRTLFCCMILTNRMQFAFTKRRAPQKAWRTAGSDFRRGFVAEVLPKGMPFAYAKNMKSFRKAHPPPTAHRFVLKKGVWSPKVCVFLQNSPKWGKIP